MSTAKPVLSGGIAAGRSDLSLEAAQPVLLLGGSFQHCQVLLILQLLCKGEYFWHSRSWILADPCLSSKHSDVSSRCSWERCRAISSTEKPFAGVSKQSYNNRRFLLCLFPEMHFHSLRCIHTGLDVCTHFHCRMDLLYHCWWNTAASLEF